MDDHIPVASRGPDSPGHDMGPDEVYEGHFRVEAVLGASNGEPQFTEVFVKRSDGQRFHEPFDETGSRDQSQDAFDGTKYYYERARLRTFAKWNPTYPVDSVDLARNGFIHIGPGDRVMCVFCLKTIKEWEEGDDVNKEHGRIYPNCPFVRGMCRDVNVPLSNLEHLSGNMG